jgi:hypothetical protein
MPKTETQAKKGEEEQPKNEEEVAEEPASQESQGSETNDIVDKVASLGKQKLAGKRKRSGV